MRNFLIKRFIYVFILVGHDTFTCLIIGRNTVSLYKENDRPLEIESSLLDVIKIYDRKLSMFSFKSFHFVNIFCF